AVRSSPLSSAVGGTPISSTISPRPSPASPEKSWPILQRSTDAYPNRPRHEGSPLMIIDVFDEPTVVDKLADGEDVAVLAALEGGPHAGVRQGWAVMQLDLDWDRQDPFGSAINALFLICDV